MKREVFADTSYWVAVIDKTDALHKTAQFASIEVEGAQIVTTESVLVEVVNFSRVTANGCDKNRFRSPGKFCFQPM